MHTNLRDLLVAASLFAHPLVAATVLNETYTASEIFSMATFPSRSPSLTMSNTRLEFPAGAAEREVLLVLPLLPANSLATLAPWTVTFTLDTALNAAGNDFGVGLSDGENFVSVRRSGVDTPESYFVEGAFSTPAFPTLVWASSATLGSGAEVFTMTFTLSTSTSATATIGSGSDSFVFTRAINRENPLSLVFWANDSVEDSGYGIDSATVTIDQVPEPACTFFLVAGLSAFAFRRNRTMA